MANIYAGTIIAVFGTLLCPSIFRGCCHNDDTGRDTDPLTVDTQDTAKPIDTGEMPEVNGYIHGTVTVQLFEIVGDDVEYVDWSAWSGGFPFGPIWVTAFDKNEETGEYSYYSEVAILSPNTTPNEYTLDIYVPGMDSVRVYAALDYWNDWVISSWDPIGLYPDTVSVQDGGTVNDIDITILAQVDRCGDGSYQLCYTCYGGPGTGGGTWPFLKNQTT